MNLKNKKVVVTGGAGLIGSFLAERLLACGARVIVADDFSKGRREYLANVLGQIEVREGDLEQVESMQRAVDGADAIFHLASRAYGIGYSAGNHLNLIEHNERITNNLLHVLMRRPVEHMLVTSSSCVYPDDAPTPLAELPLFIGQPELANAGYGWAKRFLEQKMLLLAEHNGLKLTIVRPFNIYGERYTWLGNASQAIPMLVKKVMEADRQVVMWGSGNQRRNYLHAHDCADAMAGLVEAGFTGTVNIGTEDTVTMRELVERILRVAGKSCEVIADTSKPEGRAIKSCDATLLRKSYPGFTSRINLDEGLRRMVGWYGATFAGSVG